LSQEPFEIGSYVNIVFVYADSQAEWNCSEWRCAIPARALNRTPTHRADLLSMSDFARKTPRASEICTPADVIVIQRNLFGPVLAAIQHWKARDKTIIADFDDAYHLMPPQVKNHEFWMQGLNRQVGQNGNIVVNQIDPPPITQFRWGLKLVHAATVPSQLLGDDWKDLTDIYLVPNFIDVEKYLPAPPASNHSGIHIGWGGSVSHLQSFTGSGVMKALQRVCEARPAVRVVINGGDQRIFDHLPLPDNQKILRPWVPYAHWPSELSQFDIGIAPLDGEYDQRRSWIKVLEYMLLRIPWIASEGAAYHDLRNYGWLVENKASAWERMLLEMIDHLQHYREEAQKEPYLFAMSQSMDGNVEKLISIYRTIREKALGTSLPQPVDLQTSPAMS
jgi:glycosyltransferase involved in cell wall biosynthesis